MSAKAEVLKRTTAATSRTPIRKTKKALNIPAGIAGWLWLAVVILPIYYVVITSFKDQEGFSVPACREPRLANYQLVLGNDFLQYLTNSIIVTAGAVLPSVLISFMAAYAIVRGSGRLLNGVNRMFLLGLAIPLQATIIPIYGGITRLYLYGSLLALILPSIAFVVPVSVLILANFLRDVPNELFGSVRLDGCSDWPMMWRLAFPLIRPAIATIAVYNALNVRNSFLFPLILTRRPPPARRRPDSRLQQITHEQRRRRALSEGTLSPLLLYQRLVARRLARPLPR